MIDVVVAVPEPLFRDGLARVIHQDRGLRLVADVADGRAALAAIRAQRPAVALLARELAGLSGERVLNAVVRDGLPTRVVLLDAAPGDAVVDVLGGGAAGVLSRCVSAEALRVAVRRVARGETALCPQAQSAVARGIRARRAHERPLVSPREQEVLLLVAEGLTAPQIARRLQLSTATVRTHKAHLFDKLEAHGCAQLTRNAMRRGLLE